MTFLYSMAVCSMVEINIAGPFFLGMSLLKAVNTLDGDDLNEKSKHIIYAKSK